MVTIIFFWGLVIAAFSCNIFRTLHQPYQASLLFQQHQHKQFPKESYSAISKKMNLFIDSDSLNYLNVGFALENTLQLLGSHTKNEHQFFTNLPVPWKRPCALFGVHSQIFLIFCASSFQDRIRTYTLIFIMSSHSIISHSFLETAPQRTPALVSIKL